MRLFMGDGAEELNTKKEKSAGARQKQARLSFGLQVKSRLFMFRNEKRKDIMLHFQRAVSLYIGNPSASRKAWHTLFRQCL